MAEILTPAVQISLEDFTRDVQVDYTNGTVTGEGIFDTLMETATKHLLAQFESNRIRQEDYANAYIHIYEVTLQAALKAWLEKDMVAAQIRQTEAQTAQIEASTEKIIAETGLVEPQIAKLEAETNRITEELTLITPQIEKLEAETDKITAEKALVEPQKAKLEAETALLLKQSASEDAKVDVLDAQVAYINAQAASEAGKKDLYYRQIEGFDENYKEKVMKMMVDAWGVGFSVANTAFSQDSIPNIMTKSAMDEVFEKVIKTDLEQVKYPVASGATETTISWS